MKIKNLIVISSLLISGAIFAQKDELKAAEKLLKAGDAEQAKATLSQAESLMANADASQKALFYFLKGNASYELAKKKVDESKNLVEASKSYNDLIDLEKTSKKNKYSEQALINNQDVKRLLTNSAVEDNTNKNYKESATKLYQVYLMDRKDTIMLYYAAGSALSARDNDLALDYYNQLKKMNYSGKATNYMAKSKLNDEEQTFRTKDERDKAVKIGTHANPRTEQIPSKRGEVNKNITLIYIEKGNIPEAKKSITEARKLNPDDTSLILSEADLYLKTNDMNQYKSLISEVLAKDPNNADLYYNLGVITSQSKAPGTKGEAESYYLKAIQIDPKYKNAYMNLAVLKLDGEKEIVEKMNKLTTSAADDKKYQALKKQRQDMYKSAIPYLEKAYELFDNDKDVKATLMNVYKALDMTDKVNALKARN
jgi:tetratricopeptide (TPR) repeat protein